MGVRDAKQIENKKQKSRAGKKNQYLLPPPESKVSRDVRHRPLFTSRCKPGTPPSRWEATHAAPAHGAAEPPTCHAATPSTPPHCPPKQTLPKTLNTSPKIRRTNPVFFFVWVRLVDEWRNVVDWLKARLGDSNVLTSNTGSNAERFCFYPRVSSKHQCA